VTLRDEHLQKCAEKEGQVNPSLFYMGGSYPFRLLPSAVDVEGVGHYRTDYFRN
jgi:hypothetical protein